MIRISLLALLALAPGVSPTRNAWPRGVDPHKTVHFVSVDGSLHAPGPGWTGCMHVLTGGDQPTEPVDVGGVHAVRIAAFKFNTEDDEWPVWAKEHTIDILVQFYGDSSVVDEHGQPRYFNFLTGTLPEPIAVDGGVIDSSAVNGKWNWALFRISNGLRHMDGGRLVGTIHPKARMDPGILGVSAHGGQNGGTIRLDGLPGVKIRTVAFGQEGAFGRPRWVNRYR